MPAYLFISRLNSSSGDKDSHMTPFDSKEFRRTLGAFPTGVTVITTCDDQGGTFGVTASSFNSVSLDPPLILWSQSTSSSSYPAFRDNDRFVVNILADHQIEISNKFSKSGADKFLGIATRPGLGGVPVIEDCAAHLECQKVAVYPGGDHVVYIARVEKISRSAHRSLAFGDGKYLKTFAHDLGENGNAETGDSHAVSPTALEAQRIATQALPEICELIGQRTVGIAVWGNQGATIVRWEPSIRPVSPYLQAGVVVSLTQSATGRAFAAFMKTDFVEKAIQKELLARERSGQADQGQFAQHIEEAKQHGIARAMGVAPSKRHQVTVNAFSVPVYDANNQMVMALSTTCEAGRLSSDWYGTTAGALRECARKLSEQLKHV
jgi:flavin reductase (DIM6/NTAB) family NADH-FMN oxidoreductase RutF/DNA-binding IclR family transcriptional regulator